MRYLLIPIAKRERGILDISLRQKGWTYASHSSVSSWGQVAVRRQPFQNLAVKRDCTHRIPLGCQNVHPHHDAGRPQIIPESATM